MASMEFLHQPCWTHLLIVLEAKTEGRLAKQWAKYAGPAKAVFQPSHWINKHVARNIFSGWKPCILAKKKRPYLGSLWASYFVQVHNAQRLTMDIRRTFQKWSRSVGWGQVVFCSAPSKPIKGCFVKCTYWRSKIKDCTVFWKINSLPTIDCCNIYTFKYDTRPT